MLHFTAKIKGALKTWFADLFPSIAISGNGVTLLAAQITDLENRCQTMRHRIDRQHAKTKASKAFAARVLPRSGISLPIVPGGLSGARRLHHDFIATTVADSL
jgi:hypothetical protein